MTDPTTAVINRRDADLAHLGLVELVRRLRNNGQLSQADRMEAVANALRTDHIHITETAMKVS